ncbi:TRAP transporter substrate-binding protein [Ancylobacter dichloromethanicus]|uniref:ABC transporter substrate-binding protein n=1 Tax=Ancylobacter dichloromethanicus TaxID=518825 RepID=A0A9W6J895_9HYPH|nr:TRAP transporter substrate-binding protein [Ancylobacter dichloromethanicus]MBS7552808.1 TRAP transporter substrate-binding protein [Ancylobacter dichloromethanicus]GLK72172.1 ABC transporter substrate-binding protein [Ancylobacter dichloromethanicus]
MLKSFAKILKPALFSAAAALLVASATSPASAQEVLNLKLGHIQSEQDLWQFGAQKFKEELEARSNGTITLTIYPNSTLGGDRDLVEGMQMGTVDFGLIAGVLGNFAPSIQLLELPYLFKSQEEFNKVIQGPIGEEIAANVLKNANVRILDWWERGSREVTSNKPINGIEDLKGLKIRVPEIPAMVTTWRAIGANPTPMAWSEVYTGLEQHVIEAQENPIPFIYGGRINEVQKYLAMTDHKYEYVTLTMSELRWNQLTPEQQKIVVEAAAAATKAENEAVRTQTAEMLKKMVDGGMQVTHPDTAPIAAAAVGAHEAFATKVDSDLYNRILKELGR